MFKKEIMPSPKAKLKSSMQRSLRQTLLDTYPLLGPHMDVILPRKAALSAMKLPDRVTLYLLDATPLFFQPDGSPPGPLLPHLRLVHRFPRAFPSVRVDRGAIRFILSGATLMAPGLTSAGGRLPRPRQAAAPSTAPADRPDGDGDGDDPESAAAEGRPLDLGADEDGRWSRDLDKGEPVVVMAEGKEEACAVGVLVMGTRDVSEKGKGPVMEEAHFLGDGLWKLTTD